MKLGKFMKRILWRTILWKECPKFSGHILLSSATSPTYSSYYQIKDIQKVEVTEILFPGESLELYSSVIS